LISSANFINAPVLFYKNNQIFILLPNLLSFFFLTNYKKFISAVFSIKLANPTVDGFDLVLTISFIDCFSVNSRQNCQISKAYFTFFELYFLPINKKI
jgi:hypothetical protein